MFFFSKWSDWGNNINLKKIYVILGYIYTFLANDLAFLINLVTAADISYVNECEGIMSLANMVLCNQTYVREKIADDMEDLFSNAGFGKTRDVINPYIGSKNINKALEAWR